MVIDRIYDRTSIYYIEDNNPFNDIVYCSLSRITLVVSPFTLCSTGRLLENPQLSSPWFCSLWSLCCIPFSVASMRHECGFGIVIGFQGNFFLNVY